MKAGTSTLRTPILQADLTKKLEKPRKLKVKTEEKDYVYSSSTALKV